MNCTDSYTCFQLSILYIDNIIYISPLFMSINTIDKSNYICIKTSEYGKFSSYHSSSIIYLNGMNATS